MAGPLMHEVEIEASADTLYEAISTGAGLAAFWTVDSQAEAVEGSVARFGFGPQARLEMRVDRLEPGRLAAWTCLGHFPTWTGTRVSWVLGAGPDNHTSILFKHEGWAEALPAQELASVNYTWGQVLARLKDYAESGQPKTLFR